jgi:hypothetical protein
MTVFALLAAAIVSLITAQTAAGTLSISQQHAILAEGQAAFREGALLLDSDPSDARDAFVQAAQRCTTLTDDGIRNGPLLYDLGNAWVQAGELGKGIAAYLESAQFMPNDARLAENLAHARKLVSPQFGGGDATHGLLMRLIAWHTGLSMWARIGIFTVAWCLLWGMLIVQRVQPKAAWRWLTGIGLVLSLVFAISVTVDTFRETGTYGVVQRDGVIVRKGDAASYQPTFDEPINRGVEFRILESRPVWLHVEFRNGQDGWIPRDTTTSA